MATFWVVAEHGGDGSLARRSAVAATLARSLAAAAGKGSEAAGIVVATDPAPAAKDLATYLPRVVAVTEPAADGHAWSTIAAERVAEIIGDGPDDIVIVGAGPDGRDLAGTLAALSSRGVLVNATGAAWDGGLTVEMSVFGGKLITTSGFTNGGGIVTVRPNTISAEASSSAGKVEDRTAGDELVLPQVAVRERVEESGAAAPIEEARIIVSGGRGVGGPEGFELVNEIAGELGGAVGATRAAVASGWIPYGQQFGQTGEIV
jgi:electron transfer flavoprotein alpha subunit